MRERLRLRSDDGSGELRLTFREASGADTPRPDDIAVDVEAKKDEFRGALGEVWFQRDGLDRFDPELARIVSGESPRARICNVGVEDATNEYRMELERQAAGSIQVRVRLLAVHYLASPEYQPLELSVAFDVEPVTFERFAREWTALFRVRSRGGRSSA